MVNIYLASGSRAPRRIHRTNYYILELETPQGPATAGGFCTCDETICAEIHGDYRRKPVHEHHIFYGSANRAVSEAEGLKVYLCLSHHMYNYDGNPEAIHGNPTKGSLDMWLKQTAQRKFEETHSREEFIRLIGKNYL